MNTRGTQSFFVRSIRPMMVLLAIILLGVIVIGVAKSRGQVSYSPPSESIGAPDNGDGMQIATINLKCKESKTIPITVTEEKTGDEAPPISYPDQTREASDYCYLAFGWPSAGFPISLYTTMRDQAVSECNAKLNQLFTCPKYDVSPLCTANKVLCGPPKIEKSRCSYQDADSYTVRLDKDSQGNTVIICKPIVRVVASGSVKGSCKGCAGQ